MNIQTDIKLINRIVGKYHRISLYTRGYLKSYFPGRDTKEDYPIDIVVTWINGNDKKCNEDIKKYLNLSDADISSLENSFERYREWGLLPYWFRAVERYAPWVHAVFFVTNGQKPDWLDTRNSKIRIISHSDFIPCEYMPTFCSDVIELNLWRIKDLSEHFIYFNDDVFLNRPVKPEDFFNKGMPKAVAIAEPICLRGIIKPWLRRQLNDIAIINEAFDIKKAMEIYPEKWFSHIYGRAVKYNKRAYEDSYITGMRNPHSVIPFIKDPFKQIWNEYYQALDETCRSKFRTYRDVTVRLPVLWNIFQGQFSPVPMDYFGDGVELTLETLDRAVSLIRNEEYLAVCLNDGEHTLEKDVPTIKKKLTKAFQEKFPVKSSFES